LSTHQYGDSSKAALELEQEEDSPQEMEAEQALEKPTQQVLKASPQEDLLRAKTEGSRASR